VSLRFALLPTAAHFVDAYEFMKFTFWFESILPTPPFIIAAPLSAPVVHRHYRWYRRYRWVNC
jgi:hypothetical protein